METIEFIEIVSKISTPIVLGVAGFFINRNLVSYKTKQDLNVKLIEKRIALYDEIACELNDIYQFMIRVGAWKNMSPKDVIDKKRLVDKLIHQNRPYWSLKFIDSYSDFMSECFKIKTGTGEDAKIAADTEKYVSLDSWADKFNSMFTGVKANKKNIRTKYEAFNVAVSNDINPS